MAASPPGLLTFMEAANVASAPFIHSITVRLRLLLHKMWIGTMEQRLVNEKAQELAATWVVICL